MCFNRERHSTISPIDALPLIQNWLTDRSELSALGDMLDTDSLYRFTREEIAEQFITAVSSGEFILIRCEHQIPVATSASGTGRSPSSGPSSTSPPSRPPRTTVDPGQQILLPADNDIPLFNYQIIFVDENGIGIPGLSVTLITPSGQQTLLTGSAGVANCSDIAGFTTAQLSDPTRNDQALIALLSRQRRQTPFKQPEHEPCYTPRTLPTDFSLEADTPLTVTIVLRSDVELGSHASGWAPMSATGQAQPVSDSSFGLNSVISTIATHANYQMAITAAPLTDPPTPAPYPRSERSDLGDCPYQDYVVMPDDTLVSIAEQFLGDPDQWPALWDLNASSLGDRPLGQVWPGDILSLPGTNVWPDALQNLVTTWASPSTDNDSRSMEFAIGDLHQALFEGDFTAAAAILNGLVADPLQTPEPTWPDALGESDLVFNTFVALVSDGPIPASLPVEPGDFEDPNPGDEDGNPTASQLA